MPTIKTGEIISWKEFGSRWIQGIKQITPLQMSIINLIGSNLVMVGIVIGLVSTFLAKVWWLFIILLGSFLLAGISLISTLQKYYVYKKLNEQMKGETNE